MILPKNAIIMQEEEMRYVDGGYAINMKRSTVTNLINGVTVVLGWYIGGCATVGKLISKFGKTKAVKISTQLALKVGISSSKAKKIGQLIGAVTGFSIGGGISYLLDKNDATGLNGRVQYG